MDKQSKEAKEQVKKLPLKKKLEHFWDYYKVHTLAVVIAVISIVTTAVQCARRIDYDLEVSAYTCYGLLEEDIALLTDVIRDQIYDINGNASVDIRILQNFTNIKDEGQLGETGQIVLQKLNAQLTVNECPGYIMDESYKDLILEGFPDGVKSAVKISEIPELKEKLSLVEGSSLYWVTMVEYETAKGNEKLQKKYKLVEKIEDYFNSFNVK